MKIHVQMSLTLLYSLILCGGVFAQTNVGVIIPLTGDFARYGEKVRIGIQSVDPGSVNYIYEDEGCNPKLAVSSHQKLTAADDVKIYIGPWCGSPQTAVASLLPRNNHIAILPSSAPRSVFEISKGRMLSVQHSIEEESIFNAEEAYNLGARKVVIVFLENDFSRAHEAAFRKSFKGEILSTLVYSAADASALRSVATKIKKLAPDTLYVPDAFPLMHGLLTQVSNLGLKNLKVFSVYSAQSEDVLKALGKTGEGMYLSYPKIEEDALLHFSRLSAQVLQTGLSLCPTSDPDCVLKKIKEKYKFDEYGVLEGQLGLKIIKDGKFVWFEK
jgi:ABC-type branched-subunit amino acid transport system substrate-binding protein